MIDFAFMRAFSGTIGQPWSVATGWAKVGARLLTLLGLLGAAACGSGESAENDAPTDAGLPQPYAWQETPRGDFIFVSIDTLRADHLPFYGYGRDTAGALADPFSLAWIADQGLVFDSCWAPIGKTLPSLASFWTGLFPLESGAVSNPTPLALPTFAEQFRHAGYATHAAVANRALSPGCGLEPGFDSYTVWAREREPQLSQALLQAVRPEIAAGKPLMLWAHYMAPHQPYTPPADLASRYTDRPNTPADNEALYGFHEDPSSLDAETREAIIALYDAEIVAASGWLQELLVGLDESYRAAGRGGLLEAATVVFFSDHGEELAERHGYFLHAKSLYRGVLQVPLVVAGRGAEEVQEWTGSAMSLMDVVPMLIDQRAPQRQVLAASWQTEFYALRDERWTLLHNPADNRQGPYEKPEEVAYRYQTIELYDRDADPMERVNVAEQFPEQVDRLLQELADWYAALQQREPQFLPNTDPHQARKLLHELGYVDSVPEAVVAPWTSRR